MSFARQLTWCSIRNTRYKMFSSKYQLLLSDSWPSKCFQWSLLLQDSKMRLALYKGVKRVAMQEALSTIKSWQEILTKNASSISQKLRRRLHSAFDSRESFPTHTIHIDLNKSRRMIDWEEWTGMLLSSVRRSATQIYWMCFMQVFPLNHCSQFPVQG